MKNFLIVSSSQTFLDRNIHLLSRSEFMMFTASSSSEACVVIRTREIDLLLVDIQLADMSGEEFCARIRDVETRVKSRIILVCNDDPDVVERLKYCGADALIARPVKPLHLIKTVSQFLAVQLVRSKRVPLRVKVTSKKDLVEFFGVTHNLSLTGMLIETEFALEIGNLIICRFTMPDTIAVELEGEVVRVLRTLDGAYQYGVFFTCTTREFRATVEKYIAMSSRADI